MVKYWVIGENNYHGDGRTLLYMGRSLRKAKKILEINKCAFCRIYITQVFGGK